MASATAAGGTDESSNGEAASAPFVAGASMQPALLADPLDDGSLTDAVRFCRRQIEFFTADPDTNVLEQMKDELKLQATDKVQELYKKGKDKLDQVKIVNRYDRARPTRSLA